MHSTIRNTVWVRSVAKVRSSRRASSLRSAGASGSVFRRGRREVRGILCNWLVCTAVYLASFARDVRRRRGRHSESVRSGKAITQCTT